MGRIKTVSSYKKNILKVACYLHLVIDAGSVFATAYTYPSQSAPLLISSTDDFDVNSGTFATTTGSVSLLVNYTGSNGNIDITIDSGATLSYLGTDSNGSAIQAFTNAGTSQYDLNISGTLTKGNGKYALFHDSNSATGGGVSTIKMSGAASIVGDLSFQDNGNSNEIVSIKINDTSSIDGNIYAVNDSTSFDIDILIGRDTTHTGFTSGGSFSKINFVFIEDSSVATFNHTINMKDLFWIQSGTTATINAEVSGTGNFLNDGTLTLNANVSKTGTFTGTGTSNYAKSITIDTSNYIQPTHNVTITDSLNYGKVTFTNAMPVITTLNTIYANGYFPEGRITLISASIEPVVAAYGLVPSNTLFLTFSTPFISGNSVVMDITRKAYSEFNISDDAKEVGEFLEKIGNGTPTATEIQILNSVESATTNEQLEKYLIQLAPAKAPQFESIEISRMANEQAKLRLASIRNSQYYAGFVKPSHGFWIRPYGSSALQREYRGNLGYSAKTSGIAIGIDNEIEEGITIGFAGAHSLSTVKERSNSNSTTKVKSYMGMLYGTYFFDQRTFIDWVTSAGVNQYNGVRVLNFGGINTAPVAEFSGQQYSAKAVWSKLFVAKDVLQINPEFSLQYTFSTQYEFDERGDIGALRIRQQNSNVLQSGLGIKIALPFTIKEIVGFPEVSAMFLYDVLAADNITFANFLGGGSRYVTRFRPSRFGGKVGMGITFSILENWELKVRYDFTHRRQYSNHAGYLDFKYIF